MKRRSTVREMFRQLHVMSPCLRGNGDGTPNPKYLEIATVLADALLESHRPEVGEALALAVQGRWTSYDPFRGEVGQPLHPSRVCGALGNAVTSAQQVLFPPRQSACLPNRAELRQLVMSAHGDEAETRRWMRRLWKEMQETCAGGRRSGPTLDTANSAIRGHGVESMLYETPDGREVVGFDHVNTGDTYNATVGFYYRAGVPRSRRFLITTWGDVVERTERRFPNGVWRPWW